MLRYVLAEHISHKSLGSLVTMTHQQMVVHYSQNEFAFLITRESYVSTTLAMFSMSDESICAHMHQLGRESRDAS